MNSIGHTCIKGINTWMTFNFFMLHLDKKDIFILGPKHLRITLLKDIGMLGKHYFRKYGTYL